MGHPWEQRKLGSITTRILRKNKNLESELPLTISAQDGLVDQETFFNKRVAGKDLEKYLLIRNGEFAYNKSYSAGFPWGAVKRLEKYEKGVVSSLYILFSAVENKVDPIFLETYFETDRWYDEMRIRAAEGARNHGLLNIPASDFFDINIKLPSLDEQVMVGEFFVNLNHLITLHQRKLDLLKEKKKGLLQKMFPKPGENKPELRFSGFTDPWEQRKVREISEIVGGGTPSTNNPDYWDGDIDWYTPAEITDDRFAFRSQRRITGAGLKNSSAKILPTDRTILFTSRAGIGKSAILKAPGATNQGFQSLVLNDSADPKFVYSATDFIKEKAERIAAGSTFSEISGKKLGEITLMIPSKPEQKQIGQFFESIDESITLHQRQLENLQELKKGLLQQMFV